MNKFETPDTKGLREFGLVTGGIVAALFGLLFPWLLEFDLPLWPWVVFGILGIWAIVAPGTLGPVYRGWMWIGLQLSRVTTPLVLGAVFFLVFLPVGMVLRIFGRDPMERRLDDSRETYRVKSQVRNKDHMEKPY